MIGPNKLDWEGSYPKMDDTNRTCIAWSGASGSLKMRNTKCDSSEDESASGPPKTYYDKKSGQAFDPSLLLRGYLCEARAIHTIAAYEKKVSTLYYYCKTVFLDRLLYHAT